MRSLLRTGQDLILALLAVGACVAAWRLVLAPLLTTAMDLSYEQATPMRRIGVVMALFMGYWLFAKYYERRPVRELIPRPLPIILAGLSGAALVAICMFALYVTGYYRLLSVRSDPQVWSVVALIVPSVIIEEGVFRGILFRIVERHGGTVIALCLQALIFGGLHLFNEGAAVMTVVSVMLLGALWAMIYVVTRNLWASIANHALWNITIFLSGLPLSGQEAWRLSAPLESTYEGSTLLTGGAFGPEDSLVTILAVAAAVGVLFWWARTHAGVLRPHESETARARAISSTTRTS